MAPGPGGTLFVSIPRPGGSVLALLDRTGLPVPGWPITIKNSTSCGLPWPVDDGSVRIVCDGKDLPRFDNDASDVRAFAFDPNGRSLAGWPVQLRPGPADRVIGDALTIVGRQQLTDLVASGQVSHEVWTTSVAADASIRRGNKVPMVETCCGERWAIGPDGIAYAAVDGDPGELGTPESSQLTAVDFSGLRTGWPVHIDGVASEPAFEAGGRAVVSVGSARLGTSRVLGFDRGGKAASAGSPELPFATIESGADCIIAVPRPPIVGQDGTIFVYGELDAAIFALDQSLQVTRGWPFTPVTPLERPDPFRGEEGLDCPSLAIPAVGPNSTLYLPVQARSSKVGGAVVALGPDGRVRPGWPVALKRPGSEFWLVVVGSDGTAFALAIEPESGGASSATVLAMASDSTVLWTTTIIQP